MHAPPILLRLANPARELQWRLVESLYDTTAMVVEGTLAVASALLVCGVRTHAPAFFWLFAPLLGLMVVRMWDRRQFHSAQVKRLSADADADQPDPRYWAIRRGVWAVLLAGLWAVLDLYILVEFDDPFSQMFTLMVQAGWVGGACLSNAASPAVAVVQTVLPMLATEVGVILSPGHLIKFIIPLAILHPITLLKGSRRFGAQQAATIDAEQKLSDANSRLTMLSETDGLTEIPNRRAFEAAFHRCWSGAVRQSTSVAVILLDVDFFKAYNDYYGHLGGDATLRRVADMLRKPLIRASDFAARFGGEEFIVLLPNTAEADALKVAERIRLAIATAAWPHHAAPLGFVSVSLGVAALVPGRDDQMASLIGMADAALYQAKSRGRNCVERAPTPATLDAMPEAV